MMCNFPKLGLAPTLVFVSPAQALTIPRGDHFNDYPVGNTVVPTGFVEGGSLASSLITMQNSSPIGRAYNFNLNTPGSLTSLAPFTNVGSQGFTLYAQFSLNSFSAAGGNLNGQIVALASDASGADGYRLSYVMATNVSSPGARQGAISISKGAAVGSFSTEFLTPANNTIYSLTLVGTFISPTSISFVGHLTDGVRTISVGFTDNAASYAGQYFGFRAAGDNSGSLMNANFDNFAISGFAAPNSTTVNFGQTSAPLSHLADGFLHGLSAARPSDSIIDQVGVRGLRAAPLYLDYDQFLYIRNGNPAFLAAGSWNRVLAQKPVLVGNLAYNTNHVVGKTGVYFPGDDNDWDTWSDIVGDLVTQAESEGFAGAYSVWNEPDSEFASHGGMTRFQTAYQHAYVAIKAVSPAAKVVGPEISSFKFTDLTNFLTFAKANNVLPQILTWHELIGDPSLIKDHVDQIRAWMALNGINVPEIYITEYGGYNDSFRPGNAGAFISYLESAGVNQAFKANWPMQDFVNSGNLPSLVTPDGAKLTSVGQVYKAYNQMSGSRVAAATQNPRIAVLAAKDETRKAAWVLLSHNDNAVGEQLLSLALQSLPSGLVVGGKAHFKFQWIPNTVFAPAMPQTILDEDVTVAGNPSFDVTLDPYGVMFVTITPPVGLAPPAQEFTVVDDASPSISYSSGWQTPAEPSYYNGTRHTSGNTGASADFTFTGTKLKIYTKKDFNNGVYSIFIDNMVTPVATVDAYASSALFQQLTYENNSLSSGSHTVRIKVAGQKNGASTGYFIGLDKLEYAP